MAGSSATAEVAVIGGSGFYTFLDDPREVAVETPYGDPSASVMTGTVQGRDVAFLPRHGPRHEYPPHRINYRANMWALRSLGVRRVLAVCAVGSLRPEIGPGAIVVPDQLVDRTSGRGQTFMDTGGVHVGFADPYCPALRRSTVDASGDVVDGGTMVVIEGPRFSTRAESQWYAGQGWSLVNMTGHPEAVLARELAMCYVTIAVVTDKDAGIRPQDAVSQEQVLQQFNQNIDRVRALTADVIAGLPPDRGDCGCAGSLAGMTIPFQLPGGVDT